MASLASWRFKINPQRSMFEPVNVEIPSALRPQVNDQETVAVEGQTVGDLLNTMKADYPEFGAKLFNAEGELNRFVNIYVNDEDIRFLDNLDTAVTSTDQVAVVPAIAGG